MNPVQVLGQIPRKSKSLLPSTSTTLPITSMKLLSFFYLDDLRLRREIDYYYPVSDINLDNCHWSSKMDRPTKRIHTASVDAGNDNKRIRCDESAKCSGHLSLEDHLLTNQQPSSRKSSNLGNSQLLRRLVSQQNVLRNNFANESYDSTVKGRQSVNRLERNLNADDGEGDSGGGGGVNDGGGRKVEMNEGRCRRSGVENGDAISQVSQRNPACNSVLMNLLVSGCDVSAGYVCFAKPKSSKSIAST